MTNNKLTKFNVKSSRGIFRMTIVIPATLFKKKVYRHC